MGSKSATSNLSEPRNAEDHLSLNQNEEPVACFNKLRDEVLCLKTQITGEKVPLTQCKSVPVHPFNASYYCRNARRAIATKE